jgi:hypothetical protein
LFPAHRSQRPIRSARDGAATLSTLRIMPTAHAG